MKPFDFAIIGGGIVGLSTARALNFRYQGSRILLLEKESELAQHQTGRNSGVIHSGIYYKPGSFKARFAKAGAESMVKFCEQNEIPYAVCGKLIVATSAHELPLLEKLFDRGLQNQIPVQKLTSEQVKEIEPHANAFAGIHVKTTGITDYGRVAEKFASQFVGLGGTVKLGAKVIGISTPASCASVIETTTGDYQANFVVNCAGLHSDRVAKMNGEEIPIRIVPFRGEYYELVPEKRHLVKSLIYPVPNPDFPFLGVHFTRMINGSIHAGPNAVLALSREGYKKFDLSLKDLFETLFFRGFQRLAMKHAKEGFSEFYRSVFKSAFTECLQRLVPEIKSEDLVPCESGIRAQALNKNGNLEDDFCFISSKNMLSVCNAPSPGATASIEIGEEIARRVTLLFRT